MKQNGRSADALVEAFRCIGERHGDTMRLRAARVVLGPAVIRVFEPETKGKLLKALGKVPVDQLKKLESDNDFERWFAGQLNKIAAVIRKNNRSNARIGKSPRWGHVAKVLMLYIRDIVFNSRYFCEDEVLRIGSWLYAPVDSLVIEELKNKKYGLRLPFHKIKEIDTAQKFHWVQRVLGEAARKAGVPRVFFDDIWALREPGFECADG